MALGSVIGTFDPIWPRRRSPMMTVAVDTLGEGLSFE
jgi:hypothetical protein